MERIEGDCMTEEFYRWLVHRIRDDKLKEFYDCAKQFSVKSVVVMTRATNNAKENVSEVVKISMKHVSIMVSIRNDFSSV